MQISDILVQAWPSVDLYEAQNYEQMFNDLLAKHPRTPQLIEHIRANIDWARKTLKKNDRIVWFLRWAKVYLTRFFSQPAVQHLQPGQPRPEQQPNPALAAYNQRYKTNYSESDIMALDRLKQELTHFLGLPVSEITNFVFQNQSPTEIISTFRQFEAAWRARMEEEKSLITPEEEDEVLLSFPDGYAWWLLPRGSCDAEAKAMGHCGNVPSERQGDRILSLRRQVPRGDKVYWYPVATFILDGDGMLGEMKGRNNDKPIEKYHPYIIELLNHDIIEGIKGGGYLPAHNFSMHDLDPQTREELLAAKPSLASFADYYRKEGMTDRVLSMLNSKMDSLPNYHSYDPEKKEFVLTVFRDLGRFVQNEGDEVVEGLLDLRERAETELQQATPILNVHQIYEFLSELPDRVFNPMASSIGIDPTNPNAEKEMARYIDSERGELFQQIEGAFHQVYAGNDLVARVDERIHEYVELGWYLDCDYAWVVIQNPEDLYNSPVEIRMDEGDLIGIVDAGENEDGENDYDEHAYNAQKVKNNGDWSTISWDSMNERRQEDRLIVSERGKRWNFVDAEFRNPKSIEFDIDDMIQQAAESFVSGRATPTINDPRQLELPNMPPRASTFEESLQELRQRSGIIRHA